MNRESGGATLRLGAVWDDTSPAWTAFYPDGLPEDWRLPYYAQYWKDLLVPSLHWARHVSDQVWLDEVPEDLSLYFEVPSSVRRANSAMQALAEVLGTRLGGFLLDHDDLPVDPGLSAYAFTGAPFPPMPGARGVAAYVGKAGSVLVVEPQPGLSLRHRRELLETLARTMPDRSQPLFLRCGPGELEEAETMLRLAGLS